MTTPYYPPWQNPTAPVVPVQVHWAETPEATKRKDYHILELDEMIQSGDEVLE